MYIWMYIQGMVRRCSIAQARSELPDIINAVEAGADVEITRRGHLVAVITAPERVRSHGRPTFAEAYAAFLAAHPSGKSGLPRTFARRLRDRGTGRPVRV